MLKKGPGVIPFVWLCGFYYEAFYVVLTCFLFPCLFSPV